MHYLVRLADTEYRSRPVHARRARGHRRDVLDNMLSHGTRVPGDMIVGGYEWGGDADRFMASSAWDCGEVLFRLEVHGAARAGRWTGVAKWLRVPSSVPDLFRPFARGVVCVS